MGRKILAVTLEFVIGAICRDDRRLAASEVGRFITCDGIPADARVMFAYFDGERGNLNLIVESAEWVEAVAGDPLERVYPTITCYKSHETYLLKSAVAGGAVVEECSYAELPARADPAPPADEPKPVKFREWL